MKRILLTCCIYAFFCVIASAQYTIQIQGAIFNIVLDEETKTAALRDYTYRIYDRWNSLSKTRKFKYINSKQPRTVIIPETYTSASGKEYTITTIGRAAFAGYKNMDYVVIPRTITTIEDYAFFLTSLISVEIPSSVQSIGDRAFGWCRKLKSLKIPQGVLVGKDIFTEKESKEVVVKYFANDDTPIIAQNSKKSSKKSAPVKKQFVTSSDVDDNLPQTSKQNDEMFAIIIANENYQNVARVDCALNDGRTFRRYCQEVLGIPNDNIHMIEDATFGQMTEQINWLSRVAKAYEGDAKIIIYYAGHGIPNERDASAYLLPIDNSGNNLAAAYSLKKLYAELGALNAKNVTLFMDACFSGAGRDDQMLSSARSVAIASKSERPIGNMVVFSAAQGEETAYPYAEKGHGLFTYFLLKKLKDTKGNVSYGKLSEYIRKEVSRKSIVVNSKSQTPDVKASPQLGDSWKGLTLK